MSSDHADLLRQLSIPRDAPEPAPRRWPWIVAALVVLAVLAAAGWVHRPAAGIRVQKVLAESTGGTPASGSVLDASGYVVARRQATVSSKITGKVIAIDFEEGQHVDADQVLAQLDDSNLHAQRDLAASQVEQARAQLAELRVSLANAERDQRRNRDLLERKLVAQAAVDGADTTVDQLKARIASTEQGVRVAQQQLAVVQRNLDDSVVRAPFSGVITVKNAQPGEMISPLSAGGAGTRTGLGTLVDMTSLEVEVDVNENFLNKVKAGQRATTRLNAYPEWEIPSSLIAIIPTADRSKATVKVRVGFTHAPGAALDARILPDMGARVSFLADAAPAPAAASPVQVLIPAAAVHEGQVFVIDGTQVHARPVQLGAVHGDRVAVTQGLSGGEALAVGDFGQLKNGATVQVEATP